MHGLTDRMKEEVMSLIAQSGVNRRGIIIAYQPQPPMVKAQIMPAPESGDPIETGWIPLISPWLGPGWGVLAPPPIGAQTLLVCEEADGANYVAHGLYYSDADQAPEGVQTGEFLIQHETGSLVKFNSDGSITICCTNLNVSAPGGESGTININGNVILNGEINSTGEITARNIPLSMHNHGNVKNGDGVTGLPNP